ncbi:retrovirus-related pol polyprotein from transposon TNT 1-94 [Tanacetum coccineum]
MLAPKCATYNGRSTFANPKYLKTAQSEKPRLYEIPFDTSDPATRFFPNGEETVTLEKESRSKLDKDKVKPYDYTYQTVLYETFKPPSKAYLDQLERAKEVRKTMWRKTFVRTKPNIAKNVGFLPMSKSISKSTGSFWEMISFAPLFLVMENLIQGCVDQTGNHMFCENLQEGDDLLTGSRGSVLYNNNPLQETLINFLIKEVVNGLPKLKYVKDQLCSSCEISKAKRSSFKSKAVPSSKGRLNCFTWTCLVQCELQAINGKMYILGLLMTNRYTWTLFSRSQIETPEVLKDFLTMIQRNLQAQVCYYGENLDKAEEKGDPCVMVGYSTQSKGYRVYNKRTRLIVESIHIKFDEIKEMMSDHNSSDLAPQRQMMSDHNSSDLAPQRQEMSVENVSSGLVPQGQKASDYDNSDPVPPRQNVVPSAEKPDSSHQGHEYRWTRDHPLEQVHGNPTMPGPYRRQLAKILEIVYVRAHRFGFSLAIAFTQVFSNLSVDVKTAFLMVTEGRVLRCSVGGRGKCSLYPDHQKKFTDSGKCVMDLKQAPRAWTSDHRSPKGIFINQAKYALEFWKSIIWTVVIHWYTMPTKPKLDVDLSGERIDPIWIIVKSTLEGYRSLADKLVSWIFFSKKQNCLHCLQQKAEYVVALSPLQSHATRTTLTDKRTFHYSASFIKEQVKNALPEDRFFKYLVRRIGMRCLTPAELEVSGQWRLLDI